MPQSANVVSCDRKGVEVSLYLNLGNDCSTPVWSLHKAIQGDLTLSETEDESELSLRDPAEVVKTYLEGKIDLEISGQQAVDQLYEGCAFLNSARSNGAAIDCCFLTGYMSEVGSFGWRGRWRNFDRGITGPESGASTQNFRLKPAGCQADACKVRPVWVAVADAVASYNPQTYTPTA